MFTPHPRLRPFPLTRGGPCSSQRVTKYTEWGPTTHVGMAPRKLQRSMRVLQLCSVADLVIGTVLVVVGLNTLEKLSGGLALAVGAAGVVCVPKPRVPCLATLPSESARLTTRVHRVRCLRAPSCRWAFSSHGSARSHSSLWGHGCSRQSASFRLCSSHWGRTTPIRYPGLFGCASRVHRFRPRSYPPLCMS
jgi:hypothetical protein